MRFYDGSVECSVGAAIVINDEGWIISAAHSAEPAFAHIQHQSEIAAYEQQVSVIQAGQGTDAGKRKRMRALRTNRKWITNYSYWWGVDGVQVSEYKVLGGADLALGKLEPFDPTLVPSYPTFKPQPDCEPGRSLCRLGFPFHAIAATFDAAKNAFELPPSALPIPRFPIEGIWTRTHVGRGPDGIELKFVETSSPGLRGQSGGPIFDVDGHVRGMQTLTQHLPLGFSPDLEINGRKVTEHQLLNVGVGVQSETIVAFLQREGVRVATV
jgi:hypothetical protein